MSKKTRLLGLSLALIATGVVLVARFLSDASSIASIEAPVHQEPSIVADEDLVPVETPAIEAGKQRLSVLTPRATLGANPAKEKQAAPLRWNIRGRVFDEHATPRSGVEVACNRDQDRAESDRRGVFEIETVAEQGELHVVTRGLATLIAGTFRKGSSLEPIVVVAPAAKVHGRVVDAQGMPLARASLEIAPPRDLRARFDVSLDASQNMRWKSASDPQGAFDFGVVAVAEDTHLITKLDGLEDDREVVNASDAPITIVLRRPLLLADALQGFVVDTAGAHVSGVRVAFENGKAAISDDAGRFALEKKGIDREARIFAVKRGFAPQLIDAPRDAKDAVSAWVEPVTIILAPSLSIAGDVVDETGKPVDGERVWLADPTYVGRIGGERPVAAETLASDREAKMWSFVTTDSGGKFSFDGLLDRGYHVAVLDEVTLQIVTAGPYRAGRGDAHIVLDRRAVFAPYRGRVVSQDGAPLASVVVWPTCLVFEFRSTGRVRSGDTWGESTASRQTTTDADGRFQFDELARNGVKFTFRGDSVLDAQREVPRGSAGDDTFVLETAYSLQVDAASLASKADAVRVLDVSGASLSIAVRHGQGTDTWGEVKLENGRTPVMTVSPSVRFIVLVRGGEEIARMPVQLVKKQVTRVSF